MWYSKLVKNKNDNGRPGLLDRESFDEKSIIVAREIKPRDPEKPDPEKPDHEFRKFSPIGDFILYLRNNVKTYEELCLYEVIPGNLPFKPFFDLDVERIQYMDESEILDESLKGKKIKLNTKFSITAEEGVECLEKIRDIILQLYPYINLNDIIICNSHGYWDENTKGKISYHLIVDRWCYHNIEDMYALYEEIIKYMPEKYIPVIDGGIYNRNRQFRILGSHKYNVTQESRTKKIDENSTWTTTEEVFDENHRWAQLLLASLVSNASYCKLLPSFRKEEIKSIYNGPDVELDEEEVISAVDMFAKTFLCESHEDPNFPFYVRKVNSALIDLKRVHPAYCLICNRGHDKIDQFLTIKGIEREVVLWCHRSPGDSYSLGKLKPQNDSESLNYEPGLNIADKKESIIEQIQNGSLKLQKIKSNVKAEIPDLYPVGTISNYTIEDNPLKKISQLKFKEKETKKTVRDDALSQGMSNYFAKSGYEITLTEKKLEPPDLLKIKKKHFAPDPRQRTIMNFRGEKFS